MVETPCLFSIVGRLSIPREWRASIYWVLTVSGADLNALHRTTHLVLTTSLGVDLRFTREVTEAPKPKYDSQSWQVVEMGLYPQDSHPQPVLFGLLNNCRLMPLNINVFYCRHYFWNVLLTSLPWTECSVTGTVLPVVHVQKHTHSAGVGLCWAAQSYLSWPWAV